MHLKGAVLDYKTSIKLLINDNDVTIKLHQLKHKGFKCCIYLYNFTMPWNNQRYFRKSLSNEKENCRKASWRYTASFGQNKTVGCQTRAKPPTTKVTERTKSSNFRLFLRLWVLTSCTSDVTNGAIHSPSLNGFIETNFISIRRVQRKLRQVT